MKRKSAFASHLFPRRETASTSGGAAAVADISAPAIRRCPSTLAENKGPLRKQEVYGGLPDKSYGGESKREIA